ncbi:YraN family protein [Paracoccus sp. p4-l81]|uniref:YraN family protein n=1 Tax=unclassified Paracoccus (in: a-proteobacteria) TaxID=2688777 RepID=UPI0035B84803
MRMQAARGAANYQAGLLAEACVAAYYDKAGRSIAARRWRGSQGEIDLVARDEDGLIFIEVKRARDFATAALRLSRRQMDRICGAASEYLAGEPTGQLTPMRFDVALVDAMGRVDVIENAFGLN